MSKSTVKRRGKATPRQKPDGVSASLTDRKRVGALIGGGGYDFQTKYTISQIPRLLAEPSFTHLLYEGLEDVDINFGAAEKPSREAIQVKDHKVDKGELQKIIENFRSIDQTHPGVFSRFTVACASLDGGVKTLAGKLERLRGAEKSFAGGRASLATTLKDIGDTIARFGLSPLSEFVIEKLYFQTGLPDFHNDTLARNIFILNLQELPAYSRKPKSDLKIVYDVLFQKISSSRGQTLDRAALKGLIDDTLKRRAAGRQAKSTEESVTEVGKNLKIKKGARVKNITGRNVHGTPPSSGKRRIKVLEGGEIEGKVDSIAGEIYKAPAEDDE